MQDDLNDIFVSKYLKADDLNGKEWTVVIASAVSIVMGEGAKATPKVLITFQGRKKEFVANKTNCKRIAFRHGTKLSGWIGKEIILYPELVDFQGEAVEAIRVKHPIDREQSSGNAQTNNNGESRHNFSALQQGENRSTYDTQRRTEPVRNTNADPADDREIPF